MACLRADSETGSLRSSSQTTSTRSRSSSSSSSRIPDNRERRLPGPSAARSNKRSTSLSGPAVPCAIDPNSRGLLAPYLANTLPIASRCSRRRSKVRLLYVLVTLRILRPVRGSPSALVPPIGNRWIANTAQASDLDDRTVLGFATKSGKTFSPPWPEKSPSAAQGLARSPSRSGTYRCVGSAFRWRNSGFRGGRMADPPENG